MVKATITRTWITGLVLLAAGAIVCAASVALILGYAGTFTSTPTGLAYVPRTDGFFWTLIAVCALGCLAALVGFIVQVAAWIGALINTNRLADKTWFFVLLVTGVLAFTCIFAPVAFAAMVAYLVAGSDGFAAAQTPIVTATGRAAPYPQPS